MPDTSEWTAEDREEFERDLRYEAQMERAEEARLETLMYSDPDFAYAWVADQLSDRFRRELRDLQSTCRTYNLDWVELIKEL